MPLFKKKETMPRNDIDEEKQVSAEAEKKTEVKTVMVTEQQVLFARLENIEAGIAELIELAKK